MRPIDIRYIVVHCSATRASQSYSPEALERDHRARGFRSAGYHFYIRRSGAIIPLRPLEQIGAHARGYNRSSYGVCYEGGLDEAGRPADTRTAEQRTALRQLLEHLHPLRDFKGGQLLLRKILVHRTARVLPQRCAFLGYKHQTDTLPHRLIRQPQSHGVQHIGVG